MSDESPGTNVLTRDELESLMADMRAKPKIDDDTMEKVLRLVFTLDSLFCPNEGDTLTWKPQIMTLLVFAAFWIGRESGKNTAFAVR